MKTYKVIVTLLMITSSAVFILSAQAGWLDDSVKGLGRKLDPTYENSAIREGGRRIDPTNPQSETRRQLRAFDEQRRELMHLGRQGCIAKANSVIDSNINQRSNRGLTEQEKRYLRPWFAKHIDLDRVTVSWNASLNGEMRVGGQVVWVASSAQTFGNRVFFVSSTTQEIRGN
ncbi:MAG: hypothetical protein AB7P69_07650 [Candidatus Binatia bacterium]